MAKASAFDIYVKSKAKAKAEAKRLALHEVDKLIGILQSVKSELEQKEAEKAEKEKQANIERIQALLTQSGLTPEDLTPSSKRGGKKATSKARGAVAPKYRLVVNGEEYLWTGRGRTPKVFQEYFDAGNSRESCEISN